MPLNLVRRRIDLQTDGFTLRVPAPVAITLAISLVVTALVAAFDPSPIRPAVLDRREAALVRWESEQAASVESLETPLRQLRREALRAGIEPAFSSACGGTPSRHLAGHAREAAELSRLLEARALAAGQSEAALLPSRAPIDLTAKGNFDVTDDKTLPEEIYVSSHKGTRTDPFTGKPRRHAGLDISAAAGTTVIATADGTIKFAGAADANVDQVHSLLGNYVEIEHGTSGYRTLYGHLSRVDVKAGATVHAGDKIGAVGSTGHSTGPHLHYQVMKDGSAVDPLLFIADVVLVEDGASIHWVKEAKK